MRFSLIITHDPISRDVSGINSVNIDMDLHPAFLGLEWDPSPTDSTDDLIELLLEIGGDRLGLVGDWEGEFVL